jgi:carbamoyltransferase
MTSWILGIAGSHDGAHCLLRNGRVAVAIREERLSGVKRARVHSGRESLGLRYCLDAAGISVQDLSVVVAATQHSADAVENSLALNPDLRFAPSLTRITVTHHLAHAASAVAWAGFANCAVLVCDGIGSPINDLDSATRACVRRSDVNGHGVVSEYVTLYRATGSQIIPIEVHACRDWVDKRCSGMWRFNSLGGMFAAVSMQIFGSPDDAGKVMGLAPYGRASFPIDEFLVVEDGLIQFTNGIQRYFPDELRWPEALERHRDLAASAQAALEHALLHLVRRLRACTGETRLCLAGGVALNSVANERVLREGGFDELFVAPAADDAGTALGAAYLGHWAIGGKFRAERVGTDGHGWATGGADLDAVLAQLPDVVASQPRDLLDEVARRLKHGEIGGWMMGGSELGPRALGQRSIIASPIGERTKDRINAGVKFREAFRPFAPAVLAERAAEWFSFGATATDSPFMLRVVPFRTERSSDVPAVVHVDGTGRLQTLTRRDNGLFYDLVQRFYSITGVPMLLNTSMTLRNEPIVETPEDALWMLLGTELAFCVIGDRLFIKRPSARTILEHIPFVIAREWSVRLGVSDGKLGRSVTREDAIRFTCDTPWGPTHIVLPPRLMPLVNAIDGASDGRMLQRHLNPDAAASLIEADFIHDLLLLRRMRVITLKAPP